MTLLFAIEDIFMNYTTNTVNVTTQFSFPTKPFFTSIIAASTARYRLEKSCYSILIDSSNYFVCFYISKPLCTYSTKAYVLFIYFYLNSCAPSGQTISAVLIMYCQIIFLHEDFSCMQFMWPLQSQVQPTIDSFIHSFHFCLTVQPSSSILHSVVVGVLYFDNVRFTTLSYN
jgi:hypothetical protein